MSGISVVIVEAGGVPVRAVETGAPVMVVASNGGGLPITLTEHAPPFIVQGIPDPDPEP